MKINVTFAASISPFDSREYCNPALMENRERYRIQSKRANCGNRIRQLHIMNCARVVPPKTTGYFNKELLCNLIDDILEVQREPSKQSDRVKRRLFRFAKPRKPRNPQKNTTNHSNAYKFSCIRESIGTRKIKKNYLHEAKSVVSAQLESERLSKRRAIFAHLELPVYKRARNIMAWPSDSRNIVFVKSDDGTCPVSEDTLADICKYHENMARAHPVKVRSEEEQARRNQNTQACRLSRRAGKLAVKIQEKQYQDRYRLNCEIAQESVRAFDYLGILYAAVKEGPKA